MIRSASMPSVKTWTPQHPELCLHDEFDTWYSFKFYSGHLGQHTGRLDNGLMRTMHHGYLTVMTMWQTGATDVFEG